MPWHMNNAMLCRAMPCHAMQCRICRGCPGAYAEDAREHMQRQLNVLRSGAMVGLLEAWSVKGNGTPATQDAWQRRQGVQHTSALTVCSDCVEMGA